MAGAPSSRDELNARIKSSGPVRSGPASVVLAVCLALVAGACAEEPRGPGGGPDVQTVTDDDAGTTVTLAVDEVVEARLSSNPTTGYAWHLLEDDLETDVVEVASSDYVPDPTPADEPIAGSGGVEVWRFRALQPGEATIQMVYYFGEDPSQEGGDFSFTVVVE